MNPGKRELAVVEIDRPTTTGLLPGVTVADGVNVAVAPTGNPEAVNVTGLEKDPFIGATVKEYVAGCPPGDTVCVVLEPEDRLTA